MNIGILTINDPRRGLWRDAESLLWALQKAPVRLGGQRPTSVSLFAVTNYRHVAHNPSQVLSVKPAVACPAAVPANTTLGDWLHRIDVMIVCESWLPDIVALAKRNHVRVVYVPNLDWAIYGNDVTAWVRQVQSSSCHVWAKTERVATTLRAHGIDCQLVPWSIPDAVCRTRPSRSDGAVTFLLNAGMGGWQQRRGVDIALRAFSQAVAVVPELRLVVKTIKPMAKYAAQEYLDLPGLQVIEGLLSREELLKLHDEADALLYPSRWEGFGLSLLEALHAGLPILATDGWPMNELVEHEHNGLLVASSQVGTVRLAPHWECDPSSLAQEMIRIARDPNLRRRLTCPEPSELVARQHAFVLRVRELVLGETQPRVLIFKSARGSSWRRSEEYWADALRQHGYTVTVLTYETPSATVAQQLHIHHDFVLVGKASPTFLSNLRRLTTQPIVLWHHDLSSEMRSWTEQVSRFVDLLCVPESALQERIPAICSPVFTLMPGAKVDGDRGHGRRPRTLAEPDTGADVLFLGTGDRVGTRIATLRELSKRFVVHNHGRGWQAHGLPAKAPIFGAEAAIANRQAKIVLSVSRSATTPHYTSNRLFHSCGAGACVVVERYPGVEDHFPSEAVATFSSTTECVQVVSRLLADASARACMRLAAEEHCWRWHTWKDRAAQLLQRVTNLIPAIQSNSLEQVAEMWDTRVKRMGVRAVGYYRWNDQQFSMETQRWWERLSQYLLARRTAADRVLLDFGCGVGRFTVKLAELDFTVMGTDLSREMAAIATARAGTVATIVHLQAGCQLPFVDNHFDVLWVCTVLQHIPDSAIRNIVDELRRVMRPKGLVLLCENTECSRGRTSRSGHVVFRTPVEYQDFFPGLAVADEFVVEGERHTVFAGRLE